MKAAHLVLSAALVAGASGCGADVAHPYMRPHFERCVVAREVTGPIRVDGEIDPAWRAAPAASGFYHPYRKQIVFPLTHVRAAYDRSNLYLLFRCEERAGYAYRTEAGAGQQGDSWKDDCVEAYLAPGDGSDGFYQFTLSAAGGWLQDHNDNPWQTDWQTAVKIGKTGWQAEMAIPLEAFPVAVEEGASWAINLCRHRAGEEQWSSLSPIFGGRKVVSRFQPLVFAGGMSRPAVRMLCDRALETARVRWEQSEKRRTASLGPSPAEITGEITLRQGATLSIDGKRFTVTELVNHPNVHPTYPFYYESFDRPEWKRLRDEYDFDEYVGAASDEWDTIVKLRHWVHTRITFGQPVPTNMDLFDMLDKAVRQGKTFFCTHKAQIFTQLANSFGLNARKVGIPGHGLDEIWVDRFGKWVMVDPTRDFHFEKDGVPLNLFEIRREWWRNKLADVRIFEGPTRREMPVFEAQNGAEPKYKNYIVRRNWPLFSRFKYNWIYCTFANNYFVARTDQHSPAFTFTLNDPQVVEIMKDIDAARYAEAAKRWERGYDEHNLLARADEFYWTLNTVTCHFRRCPAGLEVRFETVTPNFDSFLVEIDDKGRTANAGDLEWPLHEGRNTLSVRVRNRFGRVGRVSAVTIESE